MASLKDNLELPYYAAIIEQNTHQSADEPASASDRLVSLAVSRPGFLGLETARDPQGRPVTVSYWRELADVEAWSSEGAAGATETFPLEIRRVASPSDMAHQVAYEVPDDGRSVWRYT